MAVPDLQNETTSYTGTTLSCAMGTLYADGAGIISSATTVLTDLNDIVATLTGLKDAGAWLGPVSDDAEALFATFDAAAKVLFNDTPPGLFGVIGGNLELAASNYDAAETMIVGLFAAFTSGGDAPPPEHTKEPGNPVQVGP